MDAAVSGLVLRSPGGAGMSRLSQGDPTTASILTTGRSDDDRAIVDAVLAGDADAFRVLVDREGPAVVRACSRDPVTAPRPRTSRRRPS